MTPGIRALDALHLASAERGRAEVLLPADDKFVRAARRNAARLYVPVQHPVSWPHEATAT